jgi:uncharacterized radical SAM superfamily protein
MSWARLGKRITFYVPGMFRCDGVTGSYPAVSITGAECALACDHCGGELLRSMIPAATPETLLATGLRLAAQGHHGVLLSGGCDRQGRLPWSSFLPVIGEIKQRTDLFISVHCGLLDDETALGLKEAGVDQALIDVIGDDDTYRRVYHVDFGVAAIRSALESLAGAGLALVPHIVCGLCYGRIQGEKRALEMIADFEPELLVIVSYMKIRGTKAPLFDLPRAEEVADIIAEARFRMPEVPISLGCARQRGNSRIELLALEAGVNRMALPCDEVLERAEEYGLEMRYQRTCCSVPGHLAKRAW